MSRTTRRTQPWLFADRFGTLQNAIDGEWFYYRHRYHEDRNLTIEKAYDQAKARFHRDQSRGKWSCPSFYARQYNRFDRHQGKLELLQHFRDDSWDNQLTPIQMLAGAAHSDWFW